MTDNLNKEEEDLLQSALSDAFSPPPVTKVSLQSPAAPSSEPAADEPAVLPPSESPAESSAESLQDDWKTEYDEHLTEWRARNAEQRQKAEAERAKWEALRAQKEKEGVDWKDSILEERRKSLRLGESSTHVGGLSESTAASVSGWESVRAEPASRTSPSIADARDLTSGEQSRQTAPAGGEPQSNTSSPPTQSLPDSEPDSSKHEKWEEIPSEMTSSFPSMTIPSDPHSPTSSQHHQHPTRHHFEPHHTHGHHEHQSHHQPQVSATSALFDSRLSTKTRSLALFSSLAINLLLPFVNGVMLGFGEIFAKNVLVGWLGWKVPGSTAANVGVRARSTPWKV